MMGSVSDMVALITGNGVRSRGMASTAIAFVIVLAEIEELTLTTH